MLMGMQHSDILNIFTEIASEDIATGDTSTSQTEKTVPTVIDLCLCRSLVKTLVLKASDTCAQRLPYYQDQKKVCRKFFFVWQRFEFLTREI